MNQCFPNSCFSIQVADIKYRINADNVATCVRKKVRKCFCRFKSLARYAVSTGKYLLTPWCRVLLEQLTGLKLVKKFPGFHGTRRSITALTIVRHVSLSWASPIQSIYPHPTSWRFILILSTHLRLGLPSGFFRSGFLSS